MDTDELGDDCTKRYMNVNIPVSRTRQHEEMAWPQCERKINALWVRLEKGLNGTRYICETELLEEVALVIGNGEFASPVNHISKNANGNIITLTLQNNHLIVETEERTESKNYDEITEAAAYPWLPFFCWGSAGIGHFPHGEHAPEAQLSMRVVQKASPLVSMEDNSFVVEMEPSHTRNDIDINTRSMNGIVRSDADQQALVHREEVAECSTEFETTKLFGSINTGLSQSDLSISSHGSMNRGYRYGNQVEYEAGQFNRSLTPNTNNYNDTMSRKLDGIFEKTPDAGDTLRSEMKNSDCDKNTNNDKKHNNSHSSFNSSAFMEHQEWANADNPIDILRPDRNRYMNGETPNEAERIMSESLTDECDTCKCNKPMFTGALHKDETRETTKPQDIQQFKQSELLQRSKNLDNVSLTLGQKYAKAREQKLDSSEFVPSHTRSRSITSRLIENNVNIARTKGIEVYNQLETSLLPDLGSKFESLHNETGPIESGGDS